MTTPLLQITDLHASLPGPPTVELLKGLSLTLNPGEVHAIMGPNGSGKSTLAKVAAGHPDYEVTAGDVLLRGESLLEMSPDERSRKGLFLGFQYPVEIPGVSNAEFLRIAANVRRKERGEEELDPFDFQEVLDEKMKLLDMDARYKDRGVNEGFSGGEKKRNEIMQMLLLKPKVCILDETDSGLDIDALKIVADGVNSQRSPERSFIVITHYQRLLDFIKPDYVHVLSEGQIVKSGGPELAHELEAQGYAWLADRKGPQDEPQQNGESQA